MTAKVMQSDDPAITEFASSGEKYTALNILNMQKPCRAPIYQRWASPIMKRQPAPGSEQPNANAVMHQTKTAFN